MSVYLFVLKPLHHLFFPVFRYEWIDILKVTRTTITGMPADSKQKKKNPKTKIDNSVVAEDIYFIDSSLIG